MTPACTSEVFPIPALPYSMVRRLLIQSSASARDSLSRPRKLGQSSTPYGPADVCVPIAASSERAPFILDHTSPDRPCSRIGGMSADVDPAGFTGQTIDDRPPCADTHPPNVGTDATITWRWSTTPVAVGSTPICNAHSAPISQTVCHEPEVTDAEQGLWPTGCYKIVTE